MQFSKKLIKYLTAIALCGTVALTYADIAVIANTDLNAKTLTKSQVRAIFLGQPAGLSAAMEPVAIDHERDSAISVLFYQKIFGWSQGQLSQYWSSQIFSGQGNPPEELPTDKAVIMRVVSTPGAVGYVDEGSINAWAKAHLNVVYQVSSGQSDATKSKEADVAKTVPQKIKQKPTEAKAVGHHEKKEANHKSVHQTAHKSHHHTVTSTSAKKAKTSSSTTHKPVVNKKPHATKHSAAKQGHDFNAKLATLTKQVQQASQSLQQQAIKSGAIAAKAVAKTQPSQSKNEPAKADNSLWLDVVNHFQLQQYSDNPLVNKQVQWFLSHPQLLEKILQNAKPYLFYVYQQTRQYGMPAEIALLPMIESGYNPYAYSHAGATGLWQMMPATASSLGLVIDWWYDGRRDVLMSTQAALGYIQSLYDHFHSWLLAMAAYDAGEGDIQAIVSANQGQQVDFWSLPLPDETKQYLPKLLALAQIIKNASYYKIKLPEIINKPYFGKVELSSQMTVSQIAKLADISAKEVRHLNPGLRRWASSPNASYILLLPKDKVKAFKAALVKLSGKKQLSWMYHEVRYGETLQSIAKNYHTSAQVLQKVNGLQSDQHLQPSQGLLVPINLQHRFLLADNDKDVVLPKKDFKAQPADNNSGKKVIKQDDSLKTILSKLHGGNY